MIMSAVGRVFAVAALAVIFAIAGCTGKEKEFRKQTLTTLDGKRSITFITSEALEWFDESGERTVGSYSAEDRDTLRVDLNLGGQPKTLHYKMTHLGLEAEDGTVYYSKAALAQAKKDETAAPEEEKQEAFVDVKKLAEQAAQLLVTVKGGCYDMGNTFDKGEIDETPAHKVCLDDFQIDKFEVTQADYAAAMGVNPSAAKDCDKCPVEKVTWFEAKEYCEKFGKRLPTEAQWEYAARAGGKKVLYGNGEDALEPANANYNSDKTVPVGQYAPNAIGLYDMAGNVYEWIEDLYDRQFYERSPEKNPVWTESGRLRVLRGGSWKRTQYYLRASSRFSSSPYYRGPDAGFRCARF